MKFRKVQRWLCLLAAHCLVTGAMAQKTGTVEFTVSMPEPAKCKVVTAPGLCQGIDYNFLNLTFRAYARKLVNEAI